MPYMMVVLENVAELADYELTTPVIDPAIIDPSLIDATEMDIDTLNELL